jgi:hypothetical protein
LVKVTMLSAWLIPSRAPCLTWLLSVYAIVRPAARHGGATAAAAAGDAAAEWADGDAVGLADAGVVVAGELLAGVLAGVLAAAESSAELCAVVPLLPHPARRIPTAVAATGRAMRSWDFMSRFSLLRACSRKPLNAVPPLKTGVGSVRLRRFCRLLRG